ncbi:hypothetical protein [Variovorax rhizosphaerae]|uniref:AlgX/AlgJ SGNH hydrolase-like domain-containing protein n=1 Tax=Variovorax rhizosphaerae TaxID=1836200 RepID=A0ABU8WG55_9BURK
MSPAKLWLRVFFAGFSVIVAMLILTLFTTVPYGDLSRLARVSDDEFGWTKPPPKLPEKQFMAAVPLAEADIVVIGDSFSMTYVWQAELIRAGYKMTTIYWGSYRETMCADVQQWLIDAGFRGKLVIFESVERLLKERMRLSTQCAHMTAPFVPRLDPPVVALAQKPGFALNSGATLATGLITWDRTRRARASPGDIDFDETQVRVVPDGCALFSNPLCPKVLFFSHDFKVGELDANDFERMKAFNARNTLIPYVWMVIPDKTTTYLDPNHGKAFRDVFLPAKLGPDFFTMAFENRYKVKDLYFPNDTHMSTYGQDILGKMMLQAVREALGAPAATPQ